jgi:LuxR family transcriptional regulator, maltose regulon positive regulatory protein
VPCSRGCRPALAQGRAGSLLDIQALQALAQAAGGEQAAGLSTLAAALALGWRQGRVRVFADEGEPMRTLLAHLVAARRVEPDIAREVSLDYLGRLVRAFEPDVPAALGPGRVAEPP